EGDTAHRGLSGKPAGAIEADRGAGEGSAPGCRCRQRDPMETLRNAPGDGTAGHDRNGRSDQVPSDTVGLPKSPLDRRGLCGRGRDLVLENREAASGEVCWTRNTT